MTVRVPVLSLAMQVQLPRLSTAAIRRTITCRFAMREAATESTTVSATGRPSGMAETASATTKKKTSTRGMPRANAIAPRSAPAPTTAIEIFRANSSIRRTSGGFALSTEAIEVAIPPTCVRPAVATTTPLARPNAIVLPAKAMVHRSATGASGGSAPPAPFSTATDSPVSRDSSIRRSRASSSRRSAGTRRPDSSRTTSPGTRSSAGTSSVLPERRTVAVVVSRVRRAWALRSAFHSWTVPTAALTRTTIMMKTASVASPSASEMPAAIRRM